MSTVLMVLTCCIVVGVLLYLLLMMPRMLGKPDTEYMTKWLYAHRGLHDNRSDAPENSLKAFQRAVDAGFGMELDIQLTKDEVVVVFHDDSLKRICGVEGCIADYTYEELQQFRLCDSEERIPKFEDVLKLVNGATPLIVEFKMEKWKPRLCQLGDELLQQYQGVYCIESFHPMCVYWYRRHRKEVVRGQLAEAFLRRPDNKGIKYVILHNLLLNFLAKPDFVAYNHRHADGFARRICRKLYRNRAVAWTIKSEEELAEARKHFEVFIFDSFLPGKK